MSLKRARDTAYYPMPYIAKRPRVTPVPTALVPVRNGRTYRNTRSYGRYSYSTPYRVLTASARHTNPVYPKPEVKSIDYGADGIVFNGANPAVVMTETGGVFTLNAIAQGTNNGQRIGQSISVRSCAYRFEVDLGPTPVPCSGRVILIWDKQPNSSLTTYAAVFGYSSYLSFMYTPSMDRFVVLRNQQFSLSPQGDQALFFEGFCRINMKSVFAAGTAGVPSSGALFVMIISDQGTTAQQPLIRGCWRVRYMDN